MIVIPGARREAKAGGGLVLGPFAYEVHRTTGGAGALEHASSALEDFHPIIDRHVRAETVGLYVVLADIQWHAVELVLAEHLEAPGVKILAAHG